MKLTIKPLLFPKSMKCEKNLMFLKEEKQKKRSIQFSILQKLKTNWLKELFLSQEINSLTNPLFNLTSKKNKQRFNLPLVKITFLNQSQLSESQRYRSEESLRDSKKVETFIISKIFTDPSSIKNIWLSISMNLNQLSKLMSLQSNQKFLSLVNTPCIMILIFPWRTRDSFQLLLMSTIMCPNSDTDISQ